MDEQGLTRLFNVVDPQDVGSLFQQEGMQGGGGIECVPRVDAQQIAQQQS